MKFHNLHSSPNTTAEYLLENLKVRDILTWHKEESNIIMVGGHGLDLCHFIEFSKDFFWKRTHP
jgi:hypothetical protein